MDLNPTESAWPASKDLTESDLVRQIGSLPSRIQEPKSQDHGGKRVEHDPSPETWRRIESCRKPSPAHAPLSQEPVPAPNLADRQQLIRASKLMPNFGLIWTRHDLDMFAASYINTLPDSDRADCRVSVQRVAERDHDSVLLQFQGRRDHAQLFLRYLDNFLAPRRESRYEEIKAKLTDMLKQASSSIVIPLPIQVPADEEPQESDWMDTARRRPVNSSRRSRSILKGGANHTPRQQKIQLSAENAVNLAKALNHWMSCEFHVAFNLDEWSSLSPQTLSLSVRWRFMSKLTGPGTDRREGSGGAKDGMKSVELDCFDAAVSQVLSHAAFITIQV